MTGCFCFTAGADGAPVCDRCSGHPILAKAHKEGLERIAGREPLVMSSADAAELERRASGVAPSREGVGS